MPNPVLPVCLSKWKIWTQTHPHTQGGRTPCEDVSRDWGDVSVSEETLRIAGKPPEGGGEE